MFFFLVFKGVHNAVRSAKKKNEMTDAINSKMLAQCFRPGWKVKNKNIITKYTNYFCTAVDRRRTSPWVETPRPLPFLCLLLPSTRFKRCNFYCEWQDSSFLVSHFHRSTNTCQVVCECLQRSQHLPCKPP